MNDRVNEHYYGNPADPQTTRCRQRIHWICQQVQGERILDLGCSQGITCLALAREGFFCTGIDIDQAALNYFRNELVKESEPARYRVQIHLANASHLPFVDDSFDTIILGEILEHLTHPERVLEQARRVARENARIVITVPHGLNAYPDHKRSYYPLSLLRAAFPYFKTEVLTTLEGYIAYRGCKLNAYHPEDIAAQDVLSCYEKLALELEDRCLAKEQVLLETSTRLYAQIKTQSKVISGLSETIRHRDDALIALETEMKTLRAAHQSELAVYEKAQREAGSERGREIEQILNARTQETARRLSEHQQNFQEEMRILKSDFGKQSSVLNQSVEALRAQLDRELSTQTQCFSGHLARLEREGTERLHANQAEAGAARDAFRNMLSELQKRFQEDKAAQSEANDQWQATVAREFEAKVSRLTEAISQAKLEWAQQLESKVGHMEKQLSLLTKEQRESFGDTSAAWQARMLSLQRALEADLTQIRSALAELASVAAKKAAPRRGLPRTLAGVQVETNSKAWPLLDPQNEAAVALIRRIQETVQVSVPANATIIVISKGDDHLLELGGRRGWHFPQTTAGVYAGHHPAGSDDAIAHLEELRAKGGEFLLVPAPGFWWLEFYAEFRQHLMDLYHLVALRDDACAIFALHSPPPDQKYHVELSFKPITVTGPPAGPSARALAQSQAPRTPVEVAGTDRCPAAGKLKVGCVLDEFTAACFKPECNLVKFRPDNWRETLENTSLDFLFVESAWQGNGGSWQYKVASFKKPMGEELVDLVNYCHKRSIPTVFWNKEDPSHFQRFIHRAPLFDYVFTSDADMIPRYCEAVKHDRVFALPFAAQPKLHHPILTTDRAHSVCFAGAYYALDHDERRADIDLILRPALQYGLHIYDRQHGVVGANAKAYQFPDLYQPAIKGRLEYDDMVRAYKWYRVFLNVNSVKRSPTMFSRRVFELLASGTPVVSAYAKGIDEMLGRDLVHITESEEETSAHLKRLLNDADYWARVSAKGVREVLLRHTYSFRLAEICRQLGLSASNLGFPRIEAIATCSKSEESSRLIDTINRQSLKPSALTVIAANPCSTSDQELIRRSLSDVEVRVLPYRRDTVVRTAMEVDQGWIWRLNLNDFYGAHFLRDLILATVYAETDVIGKHTHYDWTGARLVLGRPGHDFKLVNSLSPGSVLAKAGKLHADQWQMLANNRTLVLPKQSALSTDRFNYIRHGGSISDEQGADLLANALL
jgi:2-polyprenyl-3-methyl-5-hydroxy-6-metoxy-1,4-benzoquinol methylase